MTFFCSTVSKTTTLLLLLAGWSLSFVDGADFVYSIHGSGTNNPANCFWRIMDKLQFQAALPVRFSYRGIGSGSGIREFVATTGNVNGGNAGRVIDFASADIPLPRGAYDEITAREDVIQLPVVLGAVSFFHNVPNTPNLNLTACLIAKIYKGEISGKCGMVSLFVAMVKKYIRFSPLTYVICFVFGPLIRMG